MSFTPEINADIINDIIEDNDIWDTMEDHIFDDVFFESQEDKDTVLFVLEIMNKVLAFCAQNYYSKDGCDTDNCPVNRVFSSSFGKYKCDLCKKNRNKSCDKNMTNEKALKIWSNLMRTLISTVCKLRCHTCRCPFYVATGLKNSSCYTQYTDIIYD